MYYVTMIDKFLSGWGLAQGQNARLVIACPDYNKARVIAAAAERRPEMRRVRITGSKPRAGKGTLITWRTWDDMGGPWKADYVEGT